MEKTIVLNSISKKKLFFILFSLYMVLTMCIPYGVNLLRFVLYLSVCFLSIWSADFKIKKNGLIVLICFLIYNLFSLIIGAFRSPEGAIAELRAEFLWPIFFLFWGQAISDEKSLIKTVKIIISIYTYLLIIDFLAVICGFLHINIPLFGKIIAHPILQHELGVTTDIYFWFRFWHMSTYLFMIPLTISMFIIGGYEEIIKKRTLLFLLFLELINTFTSNRSALMIIYFVTIPFSCFICFFFVRNKRIRYTVLCNFLITILLIIVSIIIFNMIIPFNFIDMLKYGIIEKVLHNNDVHADGIRPAMHRALLDGWSNSPVFGFGLGTYTNEVIRDIRSKWIYESFYHAMLFKKGIMGLAIFFLFNLWIFFSNISFCNQYKKLCYISLPMSIALFMTLIGSSEDPYLQTLGNMWMIYLPFIVANTKYKILKQEKKTKESD